MSSQKKNHHKKPSKTVRGTSEERSFGNLLQSALFGALFGILAAVLLLFAATAIGYATADPCSLTMPLALTALYLSAFVSGFAALRRNRAMALVCGSFSGLFLMLVFLVLSLLLRNHSDASFSTPVALLLRAVMIPCAAIGGYCGLSRKASKKRHTR